MTVEAPEKSVICLTCAAKGKQSNCSQCPKLQPTSLHERAETARESLSDWWTRTTDLAFAREVARLRTEREP